MATDGDGHTERAPSRHEFDTLVSTVTELERQIRQNRKDINMQFQRLAELQAVIDRMQIAAKRLRVKEDPS